MAGHQCGSWTVAGRAGTSGLPITTSRLWPSSSSPATGKGEARALSSLGEINLREGQREQAMNRRDRTLALFREIGSRSGGARALAVFGDARPLRRLPGRPGCLW